MLKRESIWAVADQALVSLGNFATNILLARFLPARQFGLFVLIYTLMLALNTAQLSLVSYPLSIMAARASSRKINEISTAGFTFTVLCLAPFSVLLTLVAFTLNAASLALPAIFALACWQLQDTARRVLLSRFRLPLTLICDVVSYVGQVVCIWLLIRFHHANLTTILLVIGFTSLVSLLLQTATVRFRLRLADFRCYRSAFWAVGKFAIGSNVINALTVLWFPWLLAAQDQALSAHFYALTTVLGLTNPVALGLGNLLLPRAAKEAQPDSRNITMPGGSRTVYLGAVLLLPYFLVLWLWPSQCLGLVYGGSSPYAATVWSLRWLVLGYLGAYLAHVFSCILFGSENGGTVLSSHVAAAIIAVAVGIPFTSWWDIAGASLAFALTQITRILVTWVLMRRTPALPIKTSAEVS